ncbi:hypothetical protein [Bathymodiolus platifrons methanotrophic gill symbiont]|uniref:hypothetical protein n=1 Tax=Bathymodiolus platifrons methanotrophic gill symbiont TaxID=113268 RepID=UPI001C8E102E|nr:hypothetical protein [Bathymodiolus platifrons methanotrophic gill symbiont]
MDEIKPYNSGIRFFATEPYRALRIGKFPCAFWRLSSRPGLTAGEVNFMRQSPFMWLMNGDDRTSQC